MIYVAEQGLDSASAILETLNIHCLKIFQQKVNTTEYSVRPRNLSYKQILSDSIVSSHDHDCLEFNPRDLLINLLFSQNTTAETIENQMLCTHRSCSAELQIVNVNI